MTKADATIDISSKVRPRRRALSLVLAPTLNEPVGEFAGVALLVPILLSVALWNGFPIIYYDSGAYILEGLGHVFIVERSPVYSLFLDAAGASYSVWAIVFLQALMTAFVMTELARAELPRLRVVSLVGIGVLVAALTGIGWYVGEIEPDCFAAVVVLAIYLLAFHSKGLGPIRSALLLAVAVLATAVHSSHIGLAAGLTLVLALLRLAPSIFRKMRTVAVPNVGFPFATFVLGFSLILAANYDYTGQIFVSRAAPVFVFARLLQDGVVKRLLDDTCPSSGYALCAYKDKLPDRADAWMWNKSSPFNALDRFKGTAAEAQRIVLDSVARYPWIQAKDAFADAATQFVSFRTGDQIEPQEWILLPALKREMPGQVRAYLAARQQRGEIRFALLNGLHVTVGVLSLLGLAALLWQAISRRDGNGLLLPAFVALALLGNAAVCGVFANPHDRYQSRVIWLPTFVLALAAARNAAFSLRKPIESGT